LEVIIGDYSGLLFGFGAATAFGHLAATAGFGHFAAATALGAFRLAGAAFAFFGHFAAAAAFSGFIIGGRQLLSCVNAGHRSDRRLLASTADFFLLTVEEQEILSKPIMEKIMPADY
jgi:hypothetical protein